MSTLTAFEPATETRAEELESEVRSYCRRWPVVFDRARGSSLYDESGERYLDFFSGAGALNYGHNDPLLIRPLVEYLQSDRMIQALDMLTVAKREFLETFDELILRPRGLRYRVQFPGPGGANAVEAALKVARKATGRTEVICFERGYHGMTLGALAVTSNPTYRAAAGTPLPHATAVPYDPGANGAGADFAWLERALFEDGGARKPAAVIVEAIQGEGGVNVARPEWLRELAARCRRHDIPLIVDDIQMGCGRTGPFFSFEEAGIEPDIVCVSKSISGAGLPMALTLIREELDVWSPGEHSGTFRGFSPALVTATAALREYWQDDALERRTIAAGLRVRAALERLSDRFAHAFVEVRGRGMVQGLVCRDPQLAHDISAAAFRSGLLVETAGPADEVVKLLPPLTIPDEELEEGLALLHGAVATACGA